MKKYLIDLLEEFKYPVFLQGTLSKDEPYPESFFTIWNNDSYDGSHYDNDAINYVWSFDVNFYSSSPSLVNSIIVQAQKKLKQNGFIITGRGFDALSDEVTHTGRAFTCQIIEKNMEV